MSWGKLYIGNKGYIPALQVNKDGNPVGTVITFAGTTAPQGYLLCDGRAVSRTVYSELFSVIGTTYGPGDGSSSFNLPLIFPINNLNLYYAIQPDYSATPTYWTTTQKTINDYGCIVCEAAAPNGTYNGRIIIKRGNNTLEIGHGELSSGNYSNTQSWVMHVMPGDIIYSSNTSCSIKFYPMNSLSETIVNCIKY